MNDVVLIHDENLPKLPRRKGIVVELLKGPHGKMRGAEVRAPNGLILKRPITKLFPIEYLECQLNEDVGENVIENVCNNMVRTKRNAAIAGEIRRQFTND